VTGRKRHIVVDTIGLLLVVVVHSAYIQDRDGARLVLHQLLGRFPRLHLIWADGGYAGELVDWAYTLGGWLIEVVKRTLNRHSFAVLPRRWVVERTLGWLGRNRRLSKDYEALPESSEAWIHIAMIHLMLKRLRPTWIYFEHSLLETVKPSSCAIRWSSCLTMGSTHKVRCTVFRLGLGWLFDRVALLLNLCGRIGFWRGADCCVPMRADEIRPLSCLTEAFSVSAFAPFGWFWKMFFKERGFPLFGIILSQYFVTAVVQY
jgi:transposase